MEFSCEITCQAQPYGYRCDLARTARSWTLWGRYIRSICCELKQFFFS